MRPLRDRLGEAMRRARVGLVRPLWADLPEDAKEDYRLAADRLAGHLANDLHFVVSDSEAG
jgi:hypothetical protein